LSARSRRAPAVLLLALLALSGLTGSAARAARGESALTAVTPTDFAGLVVMSGFRPIAVDFLWIRAEDLHRQRRYYELLSLYNLLATLDPHFEGAWVYNAFNLAYNLSMLEDTPEKRWRWVREGLLYAMKGIEKNPHSDEIAFVIAWIYRHRVPQEDYLIDRVWRDRQLNPEGKPVFELAREWAERGYRTRPHTIYIDWILDGIYRDLGKHAADPAEKLKYLRKRLEIWRYVRAGKPLAARRAAEKIRQIESEIAETESGS
jgi:hypothetical protein